MSSYIVQRERYLNKVLELRSSGMGYTKISKIIPVAEETIRRWCIKFASENTNEVMTTTKEKITDNHSPSRQEPLSEDVVSLQAEIMRLRKELAKAEIKAEAYDELINVAESKFGIQIRKKAGAKR